MKILGSNLDLQNVKAINVADGTAPTDGVNLQQLQAGIRGLSWKDEARAASTATVTLATPGTSLDGVTLNSGDRVLLKNQTAAAENGIYVWTGGSSALTRAPDADSASELIAASVLVTEGTVNHDTQWTQTADSITLGTTALVWSQFGGTGTYAAGNGIALSGSAFSVNLDTNSGMSVSGSGLKIDTSVVARVFRALVGNGSSTTITTAHGLGAIPDTNVYDASTGEKVWPDLTADATNIITTWNTAPASNAYRIVAVG